MLNMILAVLSGLGSYLTPFIGSQYADLVNATVATIMQLAQAFHQGGSVTALAEAITALQKEAQAVARDTGANQAQLTAAGGILILCGYFLSGVEAAQNGVDPSTLAVPPPVM